MIGALNAWRRVACKSLSHNLLVKSRFKLTFRNKMDSKYSLVQRGKENELSFRLFYRNKDNMPISPFHDIPLYADEANKTYNMIVEVPRWTNAKMEIATKEALNPIKQDVKNGQLRFVKNCFPHHGYIWNYGALPQTWENPKHLDESTGNKGDNDPIDVCEIGSRVHERGAVIQVKILGCFGLIDEGETDWKLIAIDVNDSYASHLNDIDDVERLMPGLLRATHEWFKIYKIPDGKPANTFAFEGKPQTRDVALRIIGETHTHWRDLITSPANDSGLDLTNVTVNDSPYKVANSESILNLAPAKEDPKVMSPLERANIDKWHHVSL